MSALVALTNIVLGIAYGGYGVMTAVEMRRDWHTHGFTHFGMAWLLMAFTCGPHHLVHGVHILFEGRLGGGLDLYSVVIGLPAGVAWLALRVEAFAGGRGDRFISGTPSWLRALPAATAVYAVSLLAGMVATAAAGVHLSALMVPNLFLVVIYLAISWFVLRTQLRNHPQLGGWSVSGLSLTVIFATCALMHAVTAVYTSTGAYAYDVHGLVIDWLSLPAGLYFLSVVRGLYRDAIHDWNLVPEDADLMVPSAALSGR
jgi:hypothetical protein